jgi:hypothetical protein
MTAHIPSPSTFHLLATPVKTALRPHLHLEYGGPRATETVNIRYQVSQQIIFGQAKYVRARVHNAWWFQAERCRVFVTSVSLNGVIVEAERSPLHWTDLDDDVFEYPYPMLRGRKNGAYVDICSTDTVDPRLKILSQKGIKRGYHRFDKAGTYTIELSAEALKPCAFGTLSLTMNYDGKNWKNLAIVSARQ